MRVEIKNNKTEKIRVRIAGRVNVRHFSVYIDGVAFDKDKYQFFIREE